MIGHVPKIPFNELEWLNIFMFHSLFWFFIFVQHRPTFSPYFFTKTRCLWNLVCKCTRSAMTWNSQFASYDILHVFYCVFPTHIYIQYAHVLMSAVLKMISVCVDMYAVFVAFVVAHFTDIQFIIQEGTKRKRSQPKRAKRRREGCLYTYPNYNQWHDCQRALYAVIICNARSICLQTHAPNRIIMH